MSETPETDERIKWSRPYKGFNGESQCRIETDRGRVIFTGYARDDADLDRVCESWNGIAHLERQNAALRELLGELVVGGHLKQHADLAQQAGMRFVTVALPLEWISAALARQGERG